ncbi:hypothetical protein M9458_050477 [Cirrhinus mrigala]|uniref:NAD(P)(+)--arginine ADP-ribosyltransferase n=1 Tax=Cirrhinus mrigala TaxID=683832 RepID=A0ABD0MY80_CIRMR
MLLIIEALLLISAALGQDHRAAAAEGGIYTLDMALNSVDDQYKGCRENMTKHVETKYLEKEINNSPDFKIAWKKGKDFVKTPHDKDLTDAIQILKKTQKKCYLTFHGTKAEFKKLDLNKEVHFGQFASSSLDLKIAQRFGTKSCFEIHTCEGADVSKYSKLPYEKEVLIPPYEKFKVTAVKTRKDQKDLWCNTVYELESSGKKSDLNCARNQPRP